MLLCRFFSKIFFVFLIQKFKKLREPLHFCTNFSHSIFTRHQLVKSQVVMKEDKGTWLFGFLPWHNLLPSRQFAWGIVVLVCFSLFLIIFIYLFSIYSRSHLSSIIHFYVPHTSAYYTIIIKHHISLTKYNDLFFTWFAGKTCLINRFCGVQVVHTKGMKRENNFFLAILVSFSISFSSSLCGIF